MSATRPRFNPSCCAGVIEECPPISDVGKGEKWVPLISAPADFPLELFERATLQLIHHPEHNSTLILRSETLSDTISELSPLVPALKGLQVVRNIHRRLLPRRPGRDAALEQFCTLYRPSIHQQSCADTLVLTPIIAAGLSLPYYHPKLSRLAFRYINASPPLIRVEVVPYPMTPTDQDSKVYRTCLALLDTLHRYGWGSMSNYKKRVMHDCLVPREPYQDLYLIMRERHKCLVSDWHEVTDPLKHVFEDVAIATYLMLIWKDQFKDHIEHQPEEGDRPWTSWARPPGGFLDIGCGNGLLTHILTKEGYSGQGIDVRARTSWSHYPEETQACLHVHAFDPTQSEPSKDPFFPPGVFVIGNHSDELTPWIPVISTIHKASGYLSIPCCAWDFDSKYERSISRKYPIPDEAWINGLNLGGDGSNSSTYSIYRIWLASLSLHCGWEVECDTLRIPSTRNWAIVGRNRIADDKEVYMHNAGAIVQRVRDRGIFKTRQPEGERTGLLPHVTP